MFIIIDKLTKQVINNMGPHPIYPNGNIPNVQLAENEQAVRMLDGSELAQKIIVAEPHSYSLVFDEDGNCVDAVVTKTIAEWQAQQPPVIPPKTELESLREQVTTVETIQSEVIDTLAIITGVTIGE